MYLPQQTPEEFRRLDQNAKAVLAGVVQGIPPTRPGVRISSNQDVFANPERQGKLYLLRDGVVSYVLDNKILFYFEPGDLIGAEHLLTKAPAQIVTDFAVVADEYDGSQFLTTVCSAPDLQRRWSEYLVLQSSLLLSLTRSLLRPPPAGSPDIRTFMPGEVIVTEGTPSDEVLALVEGEATASSQGTSVGRIEAGEIFGVLSALTETPRTATVVATTDCLVMMLPRENFLHIIESKPATVLKMIQEMGHAVMAANEPALSLSFSKF